MSNLDNNDNSRQHSRVERRRQEELKNRAEAEKSSHPEPETSPAVSTVASEKIEKPKKPKKTKNKKKRRITFWTVLKVMIVMGLMLCLGVAGYVANVIKNTPPIETDNIYSLLSQSSVMYDSKERVIDNIYRDQNRTVASISEIPLTVQNAFIALEDKTFRTHHGFNVVRIFGAIYNSVRYGVGISGTSTITQQLARNLYLEDEMSKRDIGRKVREAYIATVLEKRLSKDEIMEAYLNTVNFGGGFGIQAAARSYFSKDVSELNLQESVALAVMPNMPSAYALVLTIPIDQAAEYKDRILYTRGEYAYIWNDAGEPRMKMGLKLMLEQGMITEEEYEENKDFSVKDMVNPSMDDADSEANYFADYVISTVIKDLQTQYGYDYEKASNMVYSGGLNIYTTLDSQAQRIIEKEYNNDANFPNPTGYRTDGAGNILDKYGKVLLYKYSNYFTDDGYFRLKKSEYLRRKDGGLLLKKNKRLLFYETTVNKATDYSIEFKNMYHIKNGKFYSISGGYLSIPQSYKSLSENGNIIISPKFFEDYPDFFKKEGDFLVTKDFTLRAEVIQPQSAMVIINNKTGAIVAMQGGRQTKGRMLYNRAINPRQPGSSIKPIAVYSAALQRSYELSSAGEEYPFVDTGFDTQGEFLWGDYVTAGSVVIDEPLTVNGKIWPKNSYNGYLGMQTFRTALQQSINVCSVKILAQVGVEYAYKHTLKFGLTTLIGDGAQNDVNLAGLGVGGMTKGTTPLEMASAYTVFVNDGIHKSHYCYKKVTTRTGATILEPARTKEEVLNSGVAWIMRDILKSVVSQGIAGNARISGEQVGGKTGTTDDSVDIWFDGFTPKYTAALWIGNDVNIKLTSMSPMAASLWSKIMSQVTRAKGGTYSEKPDNVVSATFDASSGLLPDKKSKSKYTRTDYFTKGTVPTESGSYYKTVKVCTETGLLATPGCPETKKMTGFDFPYERKSTKKNKNLPQYYCHMHNTDPEKYPVDPKYKDKVIIVEPYDPDKDKPDPTDDPVIDDPTDDPTDDPDEPEENPDDEGTEPENP